ncbi:MAG: hypothetical protein U0Z53_26315 [Blastocatellia bacterium]
MHTSLIKSYSQALLLLAVMMLGQALALGADPGTPFPPGAISDQQAGSVLIFNFYTSSASNPNAENSRINLTNTSDTANAAVHLFFLEGSSCSPADYFICLTPNQTTTVNAAEFDPGTSGYVLAVAVDPATGWPVSYNHLIGDAYIKLASGYQANLAAEAVAALRPPQYDASQSTAALRFNGVEYGQLPLALAADSLSSREDGTLTMLIVNNPTGDMTVLGNPVGTLYGIMYNQLESPYSFTLKAPLCQLTGVLSDQFPRTTPRFSRIVPSGSVGWMRFWSIDSHPITGALLTFNQSATTNPAAYRQGRNLHHRTFVASAITTIPVFPGNCG